MTSVAPLLKKTPVRLHDRYELLDEMPVVPGSTVRLGPHTFTAHRE